MRKMLVASAALVVALAASPPVGAVSGDLDGNAHPNVGVMLVQDADGEIFEFCGGVLISPAIFLTNYNCPGAVAFAQSIGGRAVITFEPVLPWPPEGREFLTVEAGYIHPDANPKNGSDLYGIAVLARPVRGITPAELPTLQQLASVKKGQTLTVVGYGSNERRSATATIAAIDPGTIELLNNANATGQGGVCGDGGAPYFLGNSNVVVAVADGETGAGRCSSISWAFRNDIETARSFFDDFVAVP
ncbi:MAG: trypsin-like serine protease [Actinomycetota bacterium]